MPYVHYFIDTTSSYSWLRSLGMSNRSLSEDPEISSACLPNLYGFYHCGDGHGATPEDSVNTYWSGTFTRDGQLANNAVWREMARRSGFKMVQKAAILQWWEENLTIQDILDMPWNWNSSKHYKEVMKL